MKYAPPENAPHWFLRNLQQPGVSQFVDSSNGRVHFLSWNWHQKSLPVLILVHGFGGHAHWWSFLAPFFIDRFRVACIDLPGMGDSEPPKEYNHTCFAEGILALINFESLSEVTIVGHSFGGAQASRAMSMQPHSFKHGIVVDTLIWLGEELAIRVMDSKKQHRSRATQAECVAQFRLMPDQEIVDEAILQFIAYHSCVASENGWVWKFDPCIQNYGEITDTKQVQNISAKVDCIYGELSMFATDGRPQKALALFANPGRLVILPDAYHHLMVDHPVALVNAINTLL